MKDEGGWECYRLYDDLHPHAQIQFTSCRNGSDKIDAAASRHRQPYVSISWDPVTPGLELEIPRPRPSVIRGVRIRIPDSLPYAARLLLQCNGRPRTRSESYSH